MKQELNEIRTLAIKLYETAQEENRKVADILTPNHFISWRDTTPESMKIWDAIAVCAYRELKK